MSLIWVIIIVLVILWARRLFRSEHKLELPKDRQLDPHSDRNCHHTHHLEPPWSDMTPCASMIGPGLSKMMKSSSC